MKVSKTKKKPQRQVTAFRRAARARGDDVSEDRFNTALKTIATAIGQDDPNKDFSKPSWKKRHKRGTD